MKCRRAFTLVELLVVIAIIAILASLVLTALSMAKEKSYRAQCINNYKQLAAAFQMYADDHHDQLPGPVWLGFYEEYDNIDSTRLCRITSPLTWDCLRPNKLPRTHCWPDALRRRGIGRHPTQTRR
jgi:prepilin-type N-terminal cleavage/methylation domain-containing protein